VSVVVLVLRANQFEPQARRYNPSAASPGYAIACNEGCFIIQGIPRGFPARRSAEWQGSVLSQISAGPRSRG
jgi:hypothetical protein